MNHAEFERRQKILLDSAPVIPADYVADLLPPQAAARLVYAYKESRECAELRKCKYIEEAIAKVKFAHPELFREADRLRK